MRNHNQSGCCRMLIFFAALTCLMVLVLYFDITRYIIPNWLNALIAALYPVAVFISPEPLDWKMALAAAGLFFTVGYVIFVLKFMGGGDIKLLTVTALWIGFSIALAKYIMLVAVLGGLLALGIIIARRYAVLLPGAAEKPLPRVLQHGEPLPYGIAIAVAFLYFLWTGQIPGISAV